MKSNKNNKLVHVAVGVIIDDQQQVLIALRPDESHQGGLWEFPGGKVEAGETVQQALARELYEELGLEVMASRPLLEIEHHYSDKSVLLDVWWVDDFVAGAQVAAGTGCEGQALKWVKAAALNSYQFPRANKPIVEELQEQIVSNPSP